MNNQGFISIAEKVALKDISDYYGFCGKLHTYVSSRLLNAMGKVIRRQNRILNKNKDYEKIYKQKG